MEPPRHFAIAPAGSRPRIEASRPALEHFAADPSTRLAPRGVYRREAAVALFVRLAGWNAWSAISFERFRYSHCGAREVEIRLGCARGSAGQAKNPSEVNTCRIRQVAVSMCIYRRPFVSAPRSLLPIRRLSPSLDESSTA